MLKILNGTAEEIKNNIELLAQDYLEKLGRKVCRTCPSDIQYMLLSLKNYYKMTSFKFRKPFVQYKNNKGDKTTISNNTMTDEKAIEFLKTNPKRIELFSEFPSNWEKLITGEAETEEQKEARLAIEAELALAEKANNDDNDDDNDDDEDNDEIKAAEAAAIKAAEEAAANTSSGQTDIEVQIEEKRQELSRMSLKNLRAKYPEVKATSIKAFVDLVLKQ